MLTFKIGTGPGDLQVKHAVKLLSIIMDGLGPSDDTVHIFGGISFHIEKPLQRHFGDFTSVLDIVWERGMIFRCIDDNEYLRLRARNVTHTVAQSKFTIHVLTVETHFCSTLRQVFYLTTAAFLKRSP
jgi:hypothetical protein